MKDIIVKPRVVVAANFKRLKKGVQDASRAMKKGRNNRDRPSNLPNYANIYLARPSLEWRAYVTLTDYTWC